MRDLIDACRLLLAIRLAKAERPGKGKTTMAKAKTISDKAYWRQVRVILDAKVGGGAYAEGETWQGTATDNGMNRWFNRDDFASPHDMAEAFLGQNIRPSHCNG